MEKNPICNHREETAPKIFGKTFILCWRCTGVMMALIIMVIIRNFVNISFGVVQLVLGSLMMLPIVIDGYLQYFLKHESTNRKRSITGIMFGVGFSLVAFLLYK